MAVRLLRDLIRENLNKGHKNLVLNLAASATALGSVWTGEPA